MSNQKQTATIQDKIIKYVVLGLIALIVFFLLSFLIIPRLSLAITGYGSYGTLTGTDSELEFTDLKIVKKEAFDELEVGDIIVFDLKGSEYGEHQGLKAYRVMAIYGTGEDKYLHVHSTGNAISYPWNVTEDMYLGTVISTIPGVGSVVGFLSSGFGIAIIAVNVIIIGAVIYLVKSAPKEEKNKPEEN